MGNHNRQEYTTDNSKKFKWVEQQPEYQAIFNKKYKEGASLL